MISNLFASTQRRNRRAALGGALAVVLVVLLHLRLLPFAPALARLEWAHLDLLFKLRGTVTPSAEPCIVAIDDASFQQIGPWPWPRHKIAALLEHVLAARPALVVCDFILHAKPEEWQGTAEIARLVREASATTGTRGVILPYYFADFSRTPVATSAPLPEPIAAGSVVLFDAPALFRSQPVINAAAVYHSSLDLLSASLPGGHINVFYDEGDDSGIVRWENQLVRYGDHFLPSLPLQTAIQALALTRGQVLVRAGQGIYLGDLLVPTDIQARTLINYYGPERSFVHVPATDVLAGRAGERLAGKIVFVGVTAAGTADYLRTPTSRRMPGVEKLATATCNILNQESLRRSRALALWETAAVALIGLLALLAALRLPRRQALICLAGLVLVAWLASLGGFVWLHLWVQSGGLMLSAAAVAAVVLILRDEAAVAAARRPKLRLPGAAPGDERPEILGRFEIVRELGEGAMGKIYEGRDPTINRRVAIKTIRSLPQLSPAGSERMRQRFLREAQAAGALNHPNIVTIYQADESGPYSFIAMEYLDGKTLAEVIAEEAPLPLAGMVDILVQVCKGLDYAHQHGVVHRDIKPANIMKTKEGVVKIMDFGIAHLFASNLTQEGALLGTPNYMSPEQIRGEKVDGRADIFALGVVAYEMATRTLPFAGETMAAISHQILSATAVPATTRNPRLPAGFEEILSRAMHKDREQRYQTAGEFAAALAALAGRA